MCWLRGERVLGRLYGVRCTSIPTAYGAPPSVLTTRKQTTLGGAGGSTAHHVLASRESLLDTVKPSFTMPRTADFVGGSDGLMMVLEML